jgi:hypothetical protein
VTNALVRVGSDDAYGIYLSQMLFITALGWLGWGKLTAAVPWPLLCAATVGIVFACCIALTGLLARTPLAVPLTGRKQAPWPSLRLPIPRPHRQDSEQIPVRPAALAGTASEENGT